jgi:SpoVK/Ycf46/Vps4 family AAA+-type ATPase
VDSIILDRLNQEDGKGLVMLYGEPGTGKTSYIRRIINNVNKRVLYLPPDMATELSNPGLLPFLTDIPNSLLIVEDAENVLIKRQGQHNQAISNILNLSDGLFGDCLNIQILATFNTNLSNIDEALMRKGRLIAKYEFKKLSPDRVKKLTKKLGVKFDKDSGTLAEIYNCTDMDFAKNNRKSIGFKVAEDGILGKPTNKKVVVKKRSYKVPAK